MTIKLIGFDLDDCLFNSTDLAEKARIYGIDAMIKLGLKIDRQQAINIIQEIIKEYGSNYSEHYNLFIRRLNLLYSETYNIPISDQYKFVTAAVIAYHEEKVRSIKLYDDVEECLHKLKEKSINTAIITDGIPVKQYEKILRLKIDTLIDLIVISDEIGIRKPNPKLFDFCLKKFGVTGPETIYVGDRLDSDIIPALLNNIHSVYIHRGGKYDNFKSGHKPPKGIKPEFEISNLNEIFDIIEELNNK